MSAILDSLAAALSTALAGANLPAEVFFGREGFTREIESGPTIQILYDAGGDTYEAGSARQGDAATRFTKWTGAFVNVWGSSSKSGATESDHKEAVEALVDMFLMKLLEIAHTNKLALRNLRGSFIVPDSDAPDGDAFGAHYTVQFQLGRGLNETAAMKAAADLTPMQTVIVSAPSAPDLASGAAASVTAAGAGLSTLAGLAGITSDMVGLLLVMSGSASASNDGKFRIAAYIDATSVQIENAAAVAPDANNGALVWALYRSEIDVPGV